MSLRTAISRTRLARLRPTHALLALAFIAGAVALPTAAHAGGPSAMDRCLAGWSPDDTQTVTKPTTNGFHFPDSTNPVNAIRPGDVVKLTVTGSIQFVWNGDWLGPDGNAIPAAPNWPFPGLREYALIARWNHNPTGWVGSPTPAVSLQTCTAAPGVSTRLIFGINDTVLWDNGGLFTVRTDLYYGS